MLPLKFRNKYRISSTRLQNWDYRWAAAYFITICTQNRECYFGTIKNGNMQWSAIGIIANILWYEINNHVINIKLEAFVVMPNHIHGILILNNDDIDNNNDAGSDSDFGSGSVETLHATSLQIPETPGHPKMKNEFMATISPKSGSVSTIIRSYKSAVTKHSHRLGYEFAWQARFYDHIIRDNHSFKKIQSYIIENPLKWDHDEFCV